MVNLMRSDYPHTGVKGERWGKRDQAPSLDVSS